MNWMSNVVPPKIRSFLRRETPENLWVKCPDSGELVFHACRKPLSPAFGWNGSPSCSSPTRKT